MWAARVCYPNTLLWASSLVCCAVCSTVCCKQYTVQQLPAYKREICSVRSKLWIIHQRCKLLELFQSSSWDLMLLLLTIMHALKDAKYSSKILWLSFKSLKYPSKTASDNVQLAMNKKKTKHCIPKQMIYLSQKCAVPQPHLCQNFSTFL